MSEKNPQEQEAQDSPETYTVKLMCTNCYYTFGKTIEFGVRCVTPYQYTYEEDIFCPMCGKKSVWVEDSDGDFYLGPEYVCISCESSGTLIPWDKSNESSAQAIAQIKKALEG